jgi:hypothetical protein
MEISPRAKIKNTWTADRCEHGNQSTSEDHELMDGRGDVPPGLENFVVMSTSIRISRVGLEKAHRRHVRHHRSTGQ